MKGIIGYKQTMDYNSYLKEHINNVFISLSHQDGWVLKGACECKGGCWKQWTSIKLEREVRLVTRARVLQSKSNPWSHFVVVRGQQLFVGTNYQKPYKPTHWINGFIIDIYTILVGACILASVSLRAVVAHFNFPLQISKQNLYVPFSIISKKKTKENDYSTETMHPK